MTKSASRYLGLGVGLTLWMAAAASIQAAAPVANYDESMVPAYALPDPLRMEDGRRVTSAEMWRKERRPELLRLFEREVYGRAPGRPAALRFALLSEDKQALGGKATRREVAAYFTGREDGPRMTILIYLPNAAARPVPAFLGLNFGGNQAVSEDPGITLSTSWMRSSASGTVVNNRATEKSRGQSAPQWQVDTVLSRGYALATIYYGDIEPDSAEGWIAGVRNVFRPAASAAAPAGAESGGARPAAGGPPDAPADAWGAIGAWAWGLSRAMDYFEQEPDINEHQVAVMGHSRLGKTALWAGAEDERFAVVISNNSGCGGAALSRRAFGETVQRINTSFPHWFCGNFKKYNGREADLPVDQHQLIALMAPRPVYVASAAKDLWADPRGEFLSAKHAEPVYRLLGRDGLGVEDMPAVDQPVGGTIGYHIRTGVHDVTRYDWDRYLDFADRHFQRQAFLPPAPAGKRWKLGWHDEFNGAELDESKWNRLGDWKRRDGFWVKEDAALDGQGNLRLRTRKDGERFTCGALNTRGKFEQAFGYFEIRCEMPKEPGHWPAFWLMGSGVSRVGQDGRDGTEIDIVEIPWRDGRLTSNLHWDGYGKDHKSDGIKFSRPEVTTGFHTYGLLWLREEYVFYVDGQETWRSRAGGVCQVPLFVKVTEEIGPWAGDIRQATLPDYFTVDYVRVYEAAPESGR